MAETTTRRPARRPSLPSLPREAEVGASEVQLLRKAVNSLAIVPKSARITALGRKAYNVLLHKAQEQGMERDVYRAPLDSIIKGLSFDSNDHALIKNHLRAMVSTTVEWQSPTSGEGAIWNVCGLLSHARLTKERNQVWVEWSYAVNLKQELMDPSVFARLRLEIVTQLRTHPGVVLYEICTRYRDIGRTSRQPWRWWVPVLTGNPANERLEKMEYRIFKRDTLKQAIAEVNALTDIEVTLLEHREGRFIAEIQFGITVRKQTPLPLRHSVEPLDVSMAAQAEGMGISEEALEPLIAQHGIKAVTEALAGTQRRFAKAYPEPLRQPLKYLRAILVAAPESSPEGEADAVARVEDPTEGHERAAIPNPEEQRKRRERWLVEWKRRVYERCVAEIENMPPEAQLQLQDALLTQLETNNAHPSIIKRLKMSGWKHPLVRTAMIQYYGNTSFGPGWDEPGADDLLQIAAEL